MPKVSICIVAADIVDPIGCYHLMYLWLAAPCKNNQLTIKSCTDPDNFRSSTTYLEYIVGCTIYSTNASQYVHIITLVQSAFSFVL